MVNKNKILGSKQSELVKNKIFFASHAMLYLTNTPFSTVLNAYRSFNLARISSSLFILFVFYSFLRTERLADCRQEESLFFLGSIHDSYYVLLKFHYFEKMSLLLKCKYMNKCLAGLSFIAYF